MSTTDFDFIWSNTMSAILNGTVQCLQFYMEQYNVCYFKWNSAMSTILYGAIQCLLF